jgi:hypothetical protein
MKRMENRIKRGVLFIPIFIGGFILFTFVLMLIWNAVLPDVVGVKSITFWQALGIFALSKILFGFNKGWGGRPGWKRQAMQEKFANMTPEEKEEFKAKWKERCNSWGRKDEPPTSLAE